MSGHMDGGNYSAESKNNNQGHYDSERKSFPHQQYPGGNGPQYGMASYNTGTHNLVQMSGQNGNVPQMDRSAQMVQPGMNTHAGIPINYQYPTQQGQMLQDIGSNGPYLTSGNTNQMQMKNLTSVDPFVAIPPHQPHHYVNPQSLPYPNPPTNTYTSASMPTDRVPPQQMHNSMNYPPVNNMPSGHQQPPSYPPMNTTNPTNNQGVMPNPGVMHQPAPSQSTYASAAAAATAPPLQGKATAPKPWHSTNHSAMRNMLAEDILKLLKSRKPDAGEHWNERLPYMAKRLEDALYFEANSFEEYSEKATLKQRLQHLALSMGSSKAMKPPADGQGPPPQQPPGPGGPPQQYAPQPMRAAPQPMNPNYPPQGGMPNNYQQPPSGHANPAMQQQPPPQHPSQQHPQSHHMQMQQQPPQQGQQGPPQQQQQQPPQQSMYVNDVQQQQQQQQGHPMQQQHYGQPSYQAANVHYGNQGMVNPVMAPMMPPPGHQGYGGPPQQMVRGSSQPFVQMNNGYPVHGGIPPSSVIPQGGNTVNLVHLNVSHNEAMGYGGVPPSNAGNVPYPISQQPGGPGNSSQPRLTPDEHRKQVLKQQQQRLLLLRHASKCPNQQNCPVTPHCANMKLLWKHIMGCKIHDCKVPHCVSSRYVLSHYSKCKEATCPVCGPVREAIKKNVERNREMLRVAQNNTNQNNLAVANGAQQINPTGGNAAKANNSQRKFAKEGGEPPAKRQKKNAGGAAEEKLTITITPVAKPPRPLFPLDPLSSAIYSLTNEQIQSHLKNIHEGMKLTASKIKEMCKPMIEEFFKFPHVYGIFGNPVDPVALGLSDYFDIIKLPMDLGTILKKLDAGSYRELNNFVFDVHLTFDNAMLYNGKQSEIHQLAKNLKKEFDTKYKNKMGEYEKTLNENRKNQEACLMCGEGTLKFEPPVYYCSGPCAQRIRRNAVFYANNTNSYFWCGTCFNALKPNDVITFPDCSVTRSELSSHKKKNMEESEEEWVECNSCSRWVHQICSLFNNRRNTSEDVPYVCPTCLVEKRRSSSTLEIVEATTKKMRAADLPVCTLSAFLEKRILKRLEIAYEEFAQNLRVPVSQVEKCPPLILRQVSCLDKLQTVREGVFNRYKEQGFPADFPCRTKCLVLFQNIDGQDVMLFGMYVYEYGDTCPQPNRRRVYVSYLDSVHFLRPKQYRTIVYHEILISYLDYVKARGFHTAHIWACPPQKGDDYIFHIHPVDQKTPKPQTLRIWYDDMLKRGMERGVVCEITDLHTEYLANPGLEAVSLPYFEGDYWVNEAEEIIRNLSGGKQNDNGLGGTDSKRSKKKKNRSAKVTSTGGSLLDSDERDPVMLKLANIIEPMKDTFFVARLHPREFANSFVVKQEDSATAQEDLEAKERNEKALQEEALSGQDVVPVIAAQAEVEEEDDQGESQAPEDEEEDDFAMAAANIASEGDGSDGGVGNSMAVTSSENEDSSKDNNNYPVVKEEPTETTITTTATSSVQGKDPVGKEVCVDDEPAGSDTNTVIMETSSASVKEEDAKAGTTASSNDSASSSSSSSAKVTIPCGDDIPANLPNNTEDIDDVQECEHFETRQSFLNLCQGNQYQFDQLRRAKHSSMMVLYHLHNPDAPKFVPVCTGCHHSIFLTCRYHCDKCDLDFCQPCHINNGVTLHNHPLRMIDGNNQNTPTVLTEEQRKERQRTMILHLQLLVHASKCITCESKNCAKMKEFLQHEATCTIKAQNGCRICPKITNLLSVHARSCRLADCVVPHCQKLREQYRQLALSQQRMDDRRRIKMNSEYHRNGAAPKEQAEDDE